MVFSACQKTYAFDCAPEISWLKNWILTNESSIQLKSIQKSRVWFLKTGVRSTWLKAQEQKIRRNPQISFLLHLFCAINLWNFFNKTNKWNRCLITNDNVSQYLDLQPLNFIYIEIRHASMLSLLYTFRRFLILVLSDSFIYIQLYFVSIYILVLPKHFISFVHCFTNNNFVDSLVPLWFHSF